MSGTVVDIRGGMMDKTVKVSAFWNFHSSGGKQTVNSPRRSFQRDECYEEHQTGWCASMLMEEMVI